VGQAGTILTSPDGTTWTIGNSRVAYNLNSVAYGVTQFMAVGDGTILISPNATAWTEILNPEAINTEWIYFVIYGGPLSLPNNEFVTVGYNGYFGAFFRTIINRTITTVYLHYNLKSVTYVSYQFVAVGDGGSVLTSPNGTTWTTENSGTINNLKSVAYGNNQYVALGDGGTIVTSTNGTTWTLRSSGTNYNLNFVGYINSQFVAVGDGGTILTSSDGGTWITRNSGTTRSLKSVAYSSWKGLFVAVGDSGTILTSKVNNSGVIQRNIFKQYSDGFKTKISNNIIHVLLPKTFSNGELTLELFTIAGKRIYSATHQAYNGILNIPVSGLPTGTYLISIRGSHTALSSSFVAIK
jgi:hypothetical protein